MKISLVKYLISTYLKDLSTKQRAELNPTAPALRADRGLRLCLVIVVVKQQRRQVSLIVVCFTRPTYTELIVKSKPLQSGLKENH